MPDIAAMYIDEAFRSFRGHKRLADGAMAQLSDEQLQKKCQSANGTPMTTWKLLRSMTEHEVHHRGELYAYLGILGVKVPPLYGLTSEQLREIADSSHTTGGPASRPFVGR